MAYVRSLGLIAKGCASTGLAATVYEDFSTAHSLFGAPVVEDSEDYDQLLQLPSNMNDGRRTLLLNTSLFVWDESLNSHNYVFELAYREIFSNRPEGSPPFIVLLMGDARQIAPVVAYGSKAEILQASIIKCPHFHVFSVFQFTTILRLLNINESDHVKRYAEMLQAVSALYCFNCVIYM